MKKGLSILSVMLFLLIIIVIGAIIWIIYGYYIESKKINEIKEIADPEKEFNYYLPSEYAVLKLTRGYWDINVTGIRITFEDINKQMYNYDSKEYPLPMETKIYNILKDELNPKVPENWDFSQVNYVSLRFIMPSGRISREVYHIQINTNRTSKNFGGKCYFTFGEEGSKEITCEQ